jgi:uncharacterized protein YbaR (Trm112 family)
MDPKLLEILACPRCKESLTKGKGGMVLVCKAENLAYPIVDGIPQLVESAAIQLNKIEIAPMSQNADPHGQPSA